MLKHYYNLSPYKTNSVQYTGPGCLDFISLRANVVKKTSKVHSNYRKFCIK